MISSLRMSAFSWWSHLSRQNPGNVMVLCSATPQLHHWVGQNSAMNMLTAFSFMLDLCNTPSSSSIILGGLNVHFDIPTNPLVLRINRLPNR